MRLIELNAESFKRLKAVRIRPDSPVTPIVGRNGAGKTSVLDAIAAALGGAGESPEVPIRRGDEAAEVLLDLGDITVRRRWIAGGRSTLEVCSPDGAKYSSPQAVLDGLVGELSFDPLEFSRMKPDVQIATLGRVAGIDFEDFARKRKGKFDERTLVNRQHKAAKSQLDAMPAVEAPDEEVNVGQILQHIQRDQAANAEVDEQTRFVGKLAADVAGKKKRIESLSAELDREKAALVDLEAKHTEAVEVAATLVKVDVSDLQRQAAEAGKTNALVLAKSNRKAKADEVGSLNVKAAKLTVEIELLDAERNTAVAGAKLPVAGLAITDESILLNGIPISQCSGAEKLRLSVALGLALNPKLKLMLIRDGSLLDAEGMKLLSDMAEAADAQVLIERVQTGGEVGVRIEDGEVVGA